MSTSTVETATTGGSHQVVTSKVKVAAILAIVAGIILSIAGAVTWATVQSSLAGERITVSADSPRFAGDSVDGPLSAYQEANMIEKHYLEATGGKTYAELDREDPLRDTAMTASFLRASLFTSVVAFGIAALAFGLGIIFMIVGWGLYEAGKRPALA